MMKNKVNLNKLLNMAGKAANLVVFLGPILYAGLSLADGLTPTSVASNWAISMGSYAKIFQGACTVCGFTLLGASAFLFNEHGRVKHQFQSRLHQAILTATVGGGLLAISVLGPFTVNAAVSSSGASVGQVNGSDIVKIIGQ